MTPAYRSLVCTVLAFSTWTACADGLAPASEEVAFVGGARMRVMAANTTSGNGQSYDEGHGIRIFQGVRPDIALVQEMKYSAGERAFVDTAFGPAFDYVRGTGNIPNGIVSRYPILEGGEWDDPQVSDRGFVWARIDVPGPVDLYAVSVHLLTKSSSARDAEARSLRSQIQAVVPDGAWLTIGGDFNTDSRSEACVKTFASVVDTSGPFPVDRNNNGNTNASRGKPYDWVLVSDDLDGREIPVEIGSSAFPNGLVVDTRVYSPIAEIAPARSSDSAATAMQHMAVVRDFDVPDETTPDPAVAIGAPNGGEQFTVGETIAITWTASDVASIDLEYAADGVTFAPIATSLAASTGRFDWTVPGPATTTATLRILDRATGTSDLSDATFAIVDAPPPPSGGGVIVNEILSNEPGTATSGEFVELVNTNATALDLSGFSISDAVALRHVFPAGTTLAAGSRIVVTASAASTGALGLSNGGDTVSLKDASGAVVDSATIGSAPDGVSFNRSPDATAGAAWALHSVLSSAPSSAGTAP